MANTLAYYYTATITAVKSFIVQAPGTNPLNVSNLHYSALSWFVCNFQPGNVLEVEKHACFAVMGGTWSHNNLALNCTITTWP